MSVQLPFPELLPESDWRLPTEFPDLRGRGCKWIGVDVETCDPRLKEKGPGFIRGDAFSAGYSICADGFNAYFPVRHAEGPNIAPNVVADWLREQLGGDEPKIFCNSQYDLEALWSDRVDVKGRIWDVQIAEPLIDEDSATGYSLEALGQKYLGAGKEEELLEQAASLYSRGGKRKGKGNIPFHPKSDLWLLPPKYVGPYAMVDSLRTAAVFQEQRKVLDAEGLNQIFDLETDLVPIVLQMRLRGIRVDLEAAERTAQELTTSIDKFSMEIRKLVGFDPNIDSGLDLVKAYEEFNRKNINKVEIRYTNLGNPSFNKEWLNDQDDELSLAVSKKRKLQTLRDDFVRGDILGEQINGRVHCRWNQLRQDDAGTRSGRMSSTNPNLQQSPARWDFDFWGDDVPNWAERIRELFVPDIGKLFLKGDFSGQEPRFLVHFAGLCNLPGAAEAVETFRKNPLTDYHAFATEVCNRHSNRNFKRKQIKGINLGVMYSMGVKKLCRMLKVSENTGKEILTDYHAALPFVRGLTNKVMTVAQERGFIRTILGRKRRFDTWEPVPERREEIGSVRRGLPLDQAEKAWPGRRLQRFGTHKAGNSLIQGSAGDQTKKAMVDLYKEHKIVPSLQVHDELGGSVLDVFEGRIYKHTMEHAVELLIPVVCDTKIGPSWGSAKEEV